MAKLTIEEKTELLAKFEHYIETTEFPLIPEFAYTHDITSDNVYSWAKKATGQTDEEKLLYSRWATNYKKAMDKAEVFLNHLSIKRGQNAAPMFLLKAKHGYRDADKQEPTQITVNLPDVKNIKQDKLENTLGQLFAPAKKGQKTAN